MSPEEISALKAAIKAEIIEEIKAGLTIHANREFGSSYIDIKLKYEGEYLCSDSVNVGD